MRRPSVEWQIFQRKTERLAKSFAIGWLAMVEILRKEIPFDVMVEGVRSGDPRPVLRSIPREIWAPMQVSLLKASGSKFSGGGGFYGTIREMLLEILGEAYEDEAINLGLPFRFTMDNPYAEKWASGAGAVLVREIRPSMLEAIRDEIVKAFREGKPPIKAARDILDTGIGLTTHQNGMVTNFRRRLEQSADVQIPGWDRMTAAEKRKQITVRVKAYAERKLKERALTIARTETIGALNEGTRQSWLEAKSRGLLADDALRTWIASPQSLRTCSICRSLHGEVAPIDGPFYGEAGEFMNPPSHPQCRCRTVIAFELDIPKIDADRLDDLNEQAHEFRQAAARQRQKRLRSLRSLKASPNPGREMRSIPGYEDNVRAQ